MNLPWLSAPSSTVSPEFSRCTEGGSPSFPFLATSQGVLLLAQRWQLEGQCYRMSAFWLFLNITVAAGKAPNKNEKYLVFESHVIPSRHHLSSDNGQLNITCYLLCSFAMDIADPQFTL